MVIYAHTLACMVILVVLIHRPCHHGPSASHAAVLSAANCFHLPRDRKRLAKPGWGPAFDFCWPTEFTGKGFERVSMVGYGLVWIDWGVR